MTSPRTAAFAADGGPVGVLVSHGFTGTPASVRDWAEHLAAAGYTVRLPLLPGHGTTWQDANRTTWRDWYGAVDAAYQDLASRCSTVFACGLSMGGTLVTRLAEERGAAISGLVLVNPSYGTERADAKLAKFISWAVKSRPAIGSDVKKAGVVEPSYDRTPVPAFVSLQQLWQVVLADMPALRVPVLMYRSSEDHVVEPLSGRLLTERATNASVREVVLDNSYHVATMDNDAEQIFTGSVEFIRSLTPSTSTPGGSTA